MTSTYLVLLLCLAASASALSLQHQLTLSAQPNHQLFISIKSPYEDEDKTTPVQNSLPLTYNGCGSAPWQVALGKMVSPYLSSLTPCCNQHDICYGTSGAPDFKESFKKCNVDFKECMYDVCLDVEGRSTSSKLLCKINASTFYNAVKYFGQGPYNKSQKNHCDCVWNDHHTIHKLTLNHKIIQPIIQSSNDIFWMKWRYYICCWVFRNYNTIVEILIFFPA